MKPGRIFSCILIAWGCGLVPIESPVPQPSPKAAELLAEGGFVEAYLMRRFVDGRLLIRMRDGDGVWFLDPKVNCLWCWIYVDKTVWVKVDNRSATLLNPKGETAEFWNGGLMDKY